MSLAHRFAGGAVLALIAGPASAEIAVSGARIAEGSLIVLGQADEPNARITLDGGFDQVTDGRGRFEFRVVYHPATCIVMLKTPKAERSAVVTGCGQVGPRGEAGPAGPPGSAVSRTVKSAEALPARSPVVRQQEATAVPAPASAAQQPAPPPEPVRPPAVEQLRPRPAPPTTAALPLAQPAASPAEPVRPPVADPQRPRPSTTTTTTTTAALPSAQPAAPPAEPVRPPVVDPQRPRPSTTTTTTTTAALPSAPPTAPSIPAVGEWFVEDGTAKIAIQPCGPNLCGNVSWSKAGGELGTQILRSMKQTGPNRWEGTIHDPTTGRNYQSNISLRTQGLVARRGLRARLPVRRPDLDPRQVGRLSICCAPRLHATAAHGRSRPRCAAQSRMPELFSRRHAARRSAACGATGCGRMPGTLALVLLLVVLVARRRPGSTRS